MRCRQRGLGRGGVGDLAGDADGQAVVGAEIAVDLDLGQVVVAQELSQGLDELDV